MGAFFWPPSFLEIITCDMLPTTIDKRRSMSSRYFTRASHEDGHKYIEFSSDAPIELENLFHDVHRAIGAYIIPTEWISWVMKDCFEIIEKKESVEKLEAESYLADLMDWAKEGGCAEFCTDAIVFDEPKNFLDLLQKAQLRAKKLIFKMVKAYDDDLENEPI